MRNMKKVVCIILMALSIGLLNGCTSTEPLSVEEYLKQNNASINLNSIDDFKGLDIFKDL